MKLSIITINYNDKTGLESTIKSVISQTFKDFQYIVIDGDSTDGSKDVITQYKDKLDIAISEKDSGIYNAMNKGAKHANGEYLLFLNSGDSLLNESVLNELFKDDLQDDIVSCRMIWYNDKQQYLNTPPKNVSFFTFVGGSLPHPSTLIKNELFKRSGGYLETYRIISDWCFFLDAFCKLNASYATSNIILSKFNGFGLSTNYGESEAIAKKQYLSTKYPRFAIDYVPIEDEAIANVAFWVSSQHGLYKTFFSLPFKILNHYLRLRNTLGKRLGISKI